MTSLPPSSSESPPKNTVPPSTSFDLLAKPVRRWIWQKGWHELRDIQERAIPAIISGGADVIIAAATASFLYTVGRGGVPATLSLPAQGEPAAAAPADAAYTACLAKDRAAINKMSEEGLASDAQIELFLTRAEARCRATTGQ